MSRGMTTWRSRAHAGKQTEASSTARRLMNLRRAASRRVARLFFGFEILAMVTEGGAPKDSGVAECGCALAPLVNRYCECVMRGDWKTPSLFPMYAVSIRVTRSLSL